MPGNGRDFDIFHKSAQIVPSDAHQTIVIRVPDPVSVVLRLEQNGQNPADLLCQIALLAGIGHALCLVRAPDFTAWLSCSGMASAFVPGRREYGNTCTAAKPTCSKNSTAAA